MNGGSGRLHINLRIALAMLLGFCFGGVLEAAPRSHPTRASGTSATVKLDGIEYVDAADLARRFGLKHTWLQTGRTLILQSATCRVSLEAESREAEINGVRVFMGEAARYHKKAMRISRIDVDKLFTPIIRPGFGQAAVPRLKVIAIDAGHGGKDPGKQNKRIGVDEKDCTLDLSKRLKKLLEARGYRVVLTRTDDRFIELAERPEIARRAGADLFISLHFNAVERNPGQVSGTETYTLTPQFQRSTGDDDREAGNATLNPGNADDHWNVLLGYHLHRALLGDLKTSDRGLKRGRLAVIRLATCPAVLVEAGFLSNDAEARKINTPAYRQQIAEAVDKGVQAYANALAALRGK